MSSPSTPASASSPRPPDRRPTCSRRARSRRSCATRSPPARPTTRAATSARWPTSTTSARPGWPRTSRPVATSSSWPRATRSSTARRCTSSTGSRDRFDDRGRARRARVRRRHGRPRRAAGPPDRRAHRAGRHPARARARPPARRHRRRDHHEARPHLPRRPLRARAGRPARRRDVRRARVDARGALAAGRRGRPRVGAVLLPDRGPGRLGGDRRATSACGLATVAARSSTTSPLVAEVALRPSRAKELLVVGLGPGPGPLAHPEAADALARSTTWSATRRTSTGCPQRAGLQRHASGNTVEVDRARFALDLALRGERVAVVSGGDAGVFGMAAAVYEAAADERYAECRSGSCPVSVRSRPSPPGRARRSAADFAVLSLSDRLKPWSVIEQRLRAIAEADLVLGIYNPASRSRRDQVVAAQKLLLEHRSPDTVVVVGRDVGREEESLEVTTLGELDTDADRHEVPADRRRLVDPGQARRRGLDAAVGRVSARDHRRRHRRGRLARAGRACARAGAGAEVLLGGERHLGLVPPVDGQERRPWPRPLVGSARAAGGVRRPPGRRARVRRPVRLRDRHHVGRPRRAIVDVLPAVSSVALARARMGWSAESAEVSTLVGRDPSTLLRRELAPGRRLLVLSSDETTPACVAELLREAGFGRAG